VDVSSIHEELGYSLWEEQLRQQRGVWGTLASLRAKAEKQPSAHAANYRNILKRSIDRLKATLDDTFSATEQEAAATEYLAWYDALKVERGVPDKEWRRGHPFEAWCQKFLPEAWQRYMQAFSAVCDEPTRTNLEHLKGQTVALIEAYLENGS
jgi:hypothetical protein